MDWEGENIKIGFHPVPPQLIDINSCQVEAGSIQTNSSQIERPEFGPRLDTGSASFDFKIRDRLVVFSSDHWERNQG